MLKELTNDVIQELIRAADLQDQSQDNIWALARNDLGNEHGDVTITSVEDAEKLTRHGETPAWRKKVAIVESLSPAARLELATLLKYGQFEDASWAEALDKARRYELVNNIEGLAGYGGLASRLRAGLAKIAQQHG